jgi:hypothetical protein
MDGACARRLESHCWFDERRGSKINRNPKHMFSSRAQTSNIAGLGILQIPSLLERMEYDQTARVQKKGKQ